MQRFGADGGVGGGSGGHQQPTPPPVRRGPGRPPLNRNRPSASSPGSSATPRQWGDTSSGGAASPIQTRGPNGEVHYVPPHLHPAYRGRGRPPLSLGRRAVTGTAPALPAKKPQFPTTSSPQPQPQHVAPSHTFQQRQLHPYPGAPPSIHAPHAQQQPTRTSSNSSRQIYHPSAPGQPPPQRGSAAPGPGSTANVSGQRLRLPPWDIREPSYISAGPTNRLVLSLRSGLPSHVTWALSRLVYASVYNLDQCVLETFPGLTEELVRLVKRLVAAVHGREASQWAPSYWEQEERDFDGFGRVYDMPIAADIDSDLEDEEEGDDDDDSSNDNDNTSTLRVERPFSQRRRAAFQQDSVCFQPHLITSHKRLLDNAVSATLFLRNVSLHERNERLLLHHARTLNALICDILAMPTVLPTYAGAEEWSELQGVDELRVYALDILELTRVRLHVRTRASLSFDRLGIPVGGPPLSAGRESQITSTRVANDGQPLNENSDAAVTSTTKRPDVPVADRLFNVLVWLMHTTSDRTVLIGALRCLGALAGEERNELSFVEADISAGDGQGYSTTTPGIMRKCLSILPITQDSALLESALDCLYHVINVGENALRLGAIVAHKSEAATSLMPLLIGTGQHDAGRVVNEEVKNEQDAQKYARGIGDIHSIVRYLARDLMFGRVIWDRTHPLVLHPALHAGIPSAVNGRRREYELLRKRKRAMDGDDKEVARQRKLNKAEWLQMKDLPEPERLKAWMRKIYETNENGEVTQMEFWTTYSSQFGPYSQLGGPPLLPAAEVIRTVSAVFPGALAMVLPNQKFIVRGVEPRDRGHARRYECKWRGCAHPETDTYPAVERHVDMHVKERVGSESGYACCWSFCTYVVPASGVSDAVEHLRQHTLTHLPETEEQIIRREAAAQRQQYVEDLKRKSTIKSGPLIKAEMANGARYIQGPTAYMPDSAVAAEWRRTEAERQDAKRRKAFNLPVRGTVDMPDFLPFVVTRTPMDPQTGRPIGIASTAGLILRSLTRVAAAVISKGGSRQQRSRAAADASAATADKTSGGTTQDDKFGLPLPPVKTDAATTDTANVAAAAAGLQVSGEWAIAAAERIMDSLVDVEEDLMTVASENDILCPMLNEILVDLHPEPGESVFETKSGQSSYESDGDESDHEKRHDDSLDADGEDEDAEGSPMETND